MIVLKVVIQKSLPLLSILLLTACSPKVAEQIQWQSQPVKADAVLEEYPEMSRYLTEAKMLYFIGNDKDNIYISLKTFDEGMMRKIMMTGIVIGFDSTDRKRQKAQLHFPVGRPMPFQRPEGGKEDNGARNTTQRPDAGDRNRLQEPDNMQLTGFIGVSDGDSPVKNASGITVKLNMKQQEVFVYEAVIPFKTFFKKELDANDNGRIISLTFHFPGLDTENFAGGGRPGGSHQGGGQMGGGRRPGSGGGQQMGGERPEFEALTKEITIKKLFKLSYNSL
jgi:hypothetical protein